MDIEEVKQRIYEKHGKTITIIESTYVKFKAKAQFIHEKYGQWEALVYSVCRGSTHPQYAISKRKTTYEEFKKRLFAIHGDIITCDENSYINMRTRCTFIDAEYGEWHAIPGNIVRGMKHPQRALLQRAKSSTYTQEEIQTKLDEVHQYKVKIKEQYMGIGIKCLFEDIEYGEFYAIPLNVLRGTGHIKRAVKRRKETSQKNWGCDHPMQHEKIFKKQLKSMRTSHRILHWKTGKKLVCANRWELATCKWLNEKQIDYHWQPKAFKMPNGSTYRPDLYIPDRDLWVDIKGWYPEAWRFKCEWFKSIMPNFELWFKDNLVQLGIL
jgi:hypothetical protein